jgi:hypothetical protein
LRHGSGVRNPHGKLDSDQMMFSDGALEESRTLSRSPLPAGLTHQLDR